MFGLGWMELLIIGGAISLIVGPVATRKLLGSVRELQKAKSDLTGPGMLERLVGEDPPEDEDTPRGG